MAMKCFSLRPAVVVACLLLAACSDPPYVHDPAEFNRDHADFGKDRTDIAEVTICYNTRGATPADVTRLAVESCGEFGKSAVFEGQTYAICPLSHPVAAVFTCESGSASPYPSIPQF